MTASPISSPRVLDVKAAAVQKAVSVLLGRELSWEDSRRLADGDSIEEVVDQLRQRFKVRRGGAAAGDAPFQERLAVEEVVHQMRHPDQGAALPAFVGKAIAEARTAVAPAEGNR